MRNSPSRDTVPTARARRAAYAVGLFIAAPCALAQTVAANSLADLSIEQLAEIRVTSVTGRPVSLQQTAASIFVINAEDIRRSAASTLPQALRLAPNLQVAQLNAGQYAISARGFNNAIGNKLLVLIDGRIVYSALFSGVFWDAQDVVLEDVERIEVISGPGATLWGANAVNGVINVITRSAAETEGALVAARGGERGSVAVARYGGALGAEGRYRVYATRLDRDQTVRQDGIARPDASTKSQVGFRADWDGRSQFTLQGDAYHADGEIRGNLAPGLSGANLLARWRQQLPDGSNWVLQAYYDQSRRDDPVLFHDDARTLSVEFNHVPVTPADHRVIWGAGHRRARSEAQATPLVLFDPPLRTLAWTNVFAQDEIRLGEHLRVTAGAKLESNSFTGVEFLPSLRAAYSFSDTRLAWASLSRAVRAPARLDRDFFFPAKPPFTIKGGPGFDSEVAEVAELGYRAQPSSTLSYSLTAFHHQYRKLRGGQPGQTFIENRVAGRVYGLEGWATAALTPAWRLSGGFVELRKSLTASPGSSPSTAADLGDDPRHQWMLRSSADLPGRTELDLMVRHVSALPQPAVAAYTATDLRLTWHAAPTLDLSLMVQNLFDRNHIEYGAAGAASQIPRSAFLALEWRPK